MYVFMQVCWCVEDESSFFPSTLSDRLALLASLLILYLFLLIITIVYTAATNYQKDHQLLAYFHTYILPTYLLASRILDSV